MGSAQRSQNSICFCFNLKIICITIIHVGCESDTLSSYDAPDVPPTIDSPRESSSYITNLNSLVVELQVLTLAVVPLTDPVTISLNWNVPDPELPDAAIDIVGATEYPTPAFVM